MYYWICRDPGLITAFVDFLDSIAKNSISFKSMYVVGYIQGRQQFQMTFILGEISVQVLECPYCILPCSTSFSFSWQIQAFSLLTSALYLWGSGNILLCSWTPHLGLKLNSSSWSKSSRVRKLQRNGPVN